MIDLQYYDSLPCPHCLEPTILSDSSASMNNKNWKRATHYKCVNESCFGCAWFEVSSYHAEIRLVAKRIQDRYSYPKKVKKFIESMLGITVCLECNS